MTEPVSIKLIDREFHIACEPDERAGLLEAARFLDERMRKLRSASKSPGFDRLALLAAIDITHELLELRAGYEGRTTAMANSLAHLRQRLDFVLDQAPAPL